MIFCLVKKVAKVST
ncbi:negative regulator of flagellin synthesis FlgM, partial [Vibrio cholerae CP1037(10)]